MPRLLLHLDRRHLAVDLDDLILGPDGPIAVHAPADWRAVTADDVPVSLLADALDLVDRAAWRCPEHADELRELRTALQARRELAAPIFAPAWWPLGAA